MNIDEIKKISTILSFCLDSFAKSNFISSMKCCFFPVVITTKLQINKINAIIINIGNNLSIADENFHEISWGQYFAIPIDIYGKQLLVAWMSMLGMRD